ncbi:Uncharacterised protein [Vibrio cholerae]|nr:Uncharacterised protein [Vibrio cholerae]
MTSHVEITNRIQHFMSHKLVIETQSFFIQDTVIIQHDRAIKATT